MSRHCSLDFNHRRQRKGKASKEMKLLNTHPPTKKKKKRENNFPDRNFCWQKTIEFICISLHPGRSVWWPNLASWLGITYQIQQKWHRRTPTGHGLVLPHKSGLCTGRGDPSTSSSPMTQAAARRILHLDQWSRVSCRDLDQATQARKLTILLYFKEVLQLHNESPLLKGEIILQGKCYHR